MLVVHHPGKDDARGIRGSSALFAACDAVIKITANGNIREVTTEKVKEGVIETLFSYRLKQVSLGEDEDGDEVTSCVVEVMSGTDKAPVRPRHDSQAGRALSELEELVISRRCKPAQNHRRAPDGAMVVSKDLWRQACREKQLTGEGDPDSEGKAFWRAFQALSKLRLIGDYGKEAWLISRSTGAHFSDDWANRSSHNDE